MTEQGRWKPILEGAEAERAMEAVGAIADALRDPDNPWVNDPSMAGGQAGTALLFAYLARATESEADADVALAYLERAIEGLAEGAIPSLYSGTAGVIWVAQHLGGRLWEIDDEVEQLFGSVDEQLLELVSQGSWEGDYDLISGLVGYGVYFCERLPRPAAVNGLQEIAARLETLAKRAETGLTWRTPPELLPKWQREYAPNGYYNLGLAHGVPGIIGLLGELCAEKVAADRARPLLEGAVSWLLAQKLVQGARSFFSCWAGEGIARDPSRVAWCYGDLGLAVALLRAARRAAVPSWEREALTITRAAAGRRSREAGVIDAGLCHGAAGNAHLFNRLFQATGDPLFLDTARFWFGQTVEMREPEKDVAGYQSWTGGDDNEKPHWEPDAGFLGGATGIALALLSAARPLEPDWDRVMLADVSAGSAE